MVDRALRTYALLSIVAGGGPSDVGLGEVWYEARLALDRDARD
jgi:hypothetical protein